MGEEQEQDDESSLDVVGECVCVSVCCLVVPGKHYDHDD